MYSTSELNELFQILNLIEKDLNLKGLEPHWSNTTVLNVEGRVGVLVLLVFKQVLLHALSWTEL